MKVQYMTKSCTKLVVCEQVEVFKLYTKRRNVRTFNSVQIYAHLKETVTSSYSGVMGHFNTCWVSISTFQRA